LDRIVILSTVLDVLLGSDDELYLDAFVIDLSVWIDGEMMLITRVNIGDILNFLQLYQMRINWHFTLHMPPTHRVVYT